jgi:hypothetical protein
METHVSCRDTTESDTKANDITGRDVSVPDRHAENTAAPTSDESYGTFCTPWYPYRNRARHIGHRFIRHYSRNNNIRIGRRKTLKRRMIILPHVWVTHKTGFGLVIGFIDYSVYNHS